MSRRWMPVCALWEPELLQRWVEYETHRVAAELTAQSIEVDHHD